MGLRGSFYRKYKERGGKKKGEDRKKLTCSFCKKKLDSMGFDAWKCDECKKIFCGEHIHWKNHKCSAKMDEFKIIEEHEESIKKLGRPLGVKLILLYNILILILVIFSMLAGYGGFLGILYIVALYFGLWKMRRDWMWFLVFSMSITTVYYIYSMFAFLDVLSIIFITFNTVSIIWLINHRNIFIEPRRGKSALGTKGEWVKTILTLVGIFGIPIAVMLIDFNYIIYALLSIPIWLILVWVVFPRIYRKR